MKDSTGLAERLGPVLFHELLNDFFRDVADAALECDAEIHKYVGDEAILTWPRDRGLADGDCLACPFVARDFIERTGSDRYLERFGAVPEFRAALHYGEIVAGEIGDVRREIAYVGDTLNVAARLLDAAKTTGPRRAGLGRFAGTGDPAARDRRRAAADPHGARPSGAAWDCGAAAGRRRVLTRSSMLPRMPLGRKMMNSTSSTP